MRAHDVSAAAADKEEGPRGDEHNGHQHDDPADRQRPRRVFVRAVRRRLVVYHVDDDDELWRTAHMQRPVVGSVRLYSYLYSFTRM